MGYKQRVPTTVVAQYTKMRLGYAGAKGKSIYTLACNALSKDGKYRLLGRSEKQWVIENLPFIKAEIGKREAQREASRKAHQPTDKPHFNSSKDFLATYEWRQVRMMALKKYGAKCQCCGASPADGAVMNVDHIKPRKLFPHLALELNNLQVLCHECNHGKGNWDMTDWRNNDQATV